MFESSSSWLSETPIKTSPIIFNNNDEARRPIILKINLVFSNFEVNSFIKLLINSSDCIDFNNTLISLLLYTLQYITHEYIKYPKATSKLIIN